LVDLYSCFPSAVQVAAAELGLGVDRPLTVTGGMSFAGGPWNDYVTHAIATMLPLLREEPSAWGLCTANGGYLTKHALGVYSGRPPPEGFRWESVQDSVDALPARDLAEGHAGPVTIEAYTVVHERDGRPGTAFAACRTSEDARTWATSTAPDLLRAMTEEELVGRAGELDADGVLHLL
jgi:acetyl-CoA C-acetyltransferase